MHDATSGSEAGRSSSLRVGPAVERFIAQGARSLGMTKEDLVADAVREYLAARRGEREEPDHRATGVRLLDGTRASGVALLTGVPCKETGRLGGARER